KGTRDWLSWSHAWAHDDVLSRRKEIVSALRDFERDGHLTICADPFEPIQQVVGIVEQVKASGLLPPVNGIGVDPAGITALVDELTAHGIDNDTIVAVRQGYALAPATWGLEIKLKNKTFRHDGSGLMAWCVGNAKVEVRGGAVIITKQSSGRAKIDPL